MLPSRCLHARLPEVASFLVRTTTTGIRRALSPGSCRAAWPTRIPGRATDLGEATGQEVAFGLVAGECEGLSIGLGRFGAAAELAEEVGLGRGQVPVPGEVAVAFKVPDRGQPGLGALGHGQRDRPVECDHG